MAFFLNLLAEMVEVLTNTFRSKFTPNDEIMGQSSDVINKCLNLGYRKRDIDRMYASFKKLDVYHKNTVLFASICQVYRINTPFGELIFRQLLGVEKNKELSFEDYLVYIWNSFSVFDHKSMAQLTFQIFDADNSGKEINASFDLFSILRSFIITHLSI
jgi:Ca2+-binding EF-hand superfamily protein